MTKATFRELFGTKREAQAAARRIERKGYRVTVTCVKPAGHKDYAWLVQAY